VTGGGAGLADRMHRLHCSHHLLVGISDSTIVRTVGRLRKSRYRRPRACRPARSSCAGRRRMRRQAADDARRLPERRRLPRQGIGQERERHIAKRRRLHADPLCRRPGGPPPARVAVAADDGADRSRRRRLAGKSVTELAAPRLRAAGRRPLRWGYSGLARGAVRFRTGSDPGGSSPKDPSPVPRLFASGAGKPNPAVLQRFQRFDGESAIRCGALKSA
jgi:hypothetical protein